MPLCSPSITVVRASITSRSPTDTLRPKRHARSWVGLPISVFRPDTQSTAAGMWTDVRIGDIRFPGQPLQSGQSVYGPTLLIPTACANDRYWHLASVRCDAELGPLSASQRT